MIYKSTYLFLLVPVIIVIVILYFYSFAYAASTKIIPDNSSACGAGVFCEWAWSDVIGWIDFLPTEPPASANIIVSDAEITGYAASGVGFISLNCVSQVPGGPAPTCVGGAGNWRITVNPLTGELAGWAWNDQIGWISFSCANSVPGFPNGTCSSLNYGVNIVISEGGTHCTAIDPIPPTTCGDFNGWAWNDVIGWISFNCGNSGAGGCSIQYKVKTSWEPPAPTLPAGDLTSSIFDTQAPDGAAINTIMWRGDPPAGAPINPGQYVSFQIATDCLPNQGTPPACTDGAAGWNFVGPNGTNGSYYFDSVGPNRPIPINQTYHSNKRYVRYKVFLSPCSPPICASSESPQVDDVIINWSP